VGSERRGERCSAATWGGAEKSQRDLMDSNWALVVLTAVLILVTGYYARQNKRLVDEMREQ